ncbi:hypothetical protein ACROYT_G011769 [Oculina patagonica]
MVLRDFTGDENYLFNPAGWMFDEAGGNWDAIENVFGKEALEQCVSCEFHFFQCCNRQVHTDWSDKAKHRFKTLARSIFEAPTPYQYDQARKELIAFSQEKPGKREVGHSQWAKKGSYRLTLAMAAEEDVAEAIMLSKKLESYGYGNYKGGQHRSQSDRLKANYFQQMARAKAFAEEISAGVVDNTLYVAAESSRASTVDANCSHRATRKRKRQVSVFSDGTHLESSSSEDDSQQTADKDGAKEDKRDGRFRTTASKAFQRSLELAKKEKLVVVDSNELGRNEREFTIRSGLNTYNATISEHPTCDCPYANSANICKHVLFVLLNFFQVKEGDYRLHQKALTKSEVDALFKGLNLKSPTGTKPTNAAIFNKHKEAKKKQVWQVQRCNTQPGPKPRCAKPGCQNQFSAGDICISVEGLYVPSNETADGRSFAVERTFRFCARKECINTQPKQSNLIVPPMTVMLPENVNVTPEEYQNLINEEIV